MTPFHRKGINAGLSGVCTCIIIQLNVPLPLHALKLTHVRMIRDVPVLAFWVYDGIGVSSGFAAEIVGDWGTSSSLDGLSSLLARDSEGLETVVKSVEATSRTSFIPAKTLTRPVIASTLDAS